jgi:hypothetical protein
VEPIAADRHLDGHEALTLPSSQRPKRWLFVVPLVALLLVLIGLAGWLFVRRGERPPAASDDGSGGAPLGLTPGPAREPPTPRPALVQTADAGSAAPAEPEVPIVPVRNDDPRPDGPMHPHPITPEHVRIQRENNLIGALNGAMDVNDGPGLRRLLGQYRDEFPDDPNLLQEGYQIIADCLEHPGAVSRAVAQRYYDRERGSILRRFVSRHCLEP